MACPCGAHWCWYCLRSTDDCIGECSPGDGANDPDFNDFHEDDENGSDNSDQDMPEAEDAETQEDVHNEDPEPSRAVQQDLITNQMPSSSVTPRNLDGGGDARWEGTHEDFGDEP